MAMVVPGGKGGGWILGREWGGEVVGGRVVWGGGEAGDGEEVGGGRGERRRRADGRWGQGSEGGREVGGVGGGWVGARGEEMGRACGRERLEWVEVDVGGERRRRWWWERGDGRRIKSRLFTYFESVSRMI